MIAVARIRIVTCLSLAGVLCMPAVASARHNAAPARRADKPTAAAPTTPKPATVAPATTPAPVTTPNAAAPPAGGTPPPAGAPVPSDDQEVTRYTFTGLDIDGELRTPALLQFLARIGGEFETVGIPHRSFMPELSFTVTEDAL